jgi:hypothetical protein
VLEYELFDEGDCGLSDGVDATVGEDDNLDDNDGGNNDDCGTGVSDSTDNDVNRDGSVVDDSFIDECDTVKGNRNEGFGDDEYNTNCDEDEVEDDCVDGDCVNDDSNGEDEDEEEEESGNKGDTYVDVGDECKDGGLLWKLTELLEGCSTYVILEDTEDGGS